MQLRPIGAVQPSAYNPRTADPARLDLIELSLSKLGFLIPVFVDSAGDISSGHQRTHVAERMGLSLVPVEVMGKDMDLDMRRSVNVIFNRATNDMIASTSPKALAEQLTHANIHDMAQSIEDVDRSNPRTMYPCMYPERRSVTVLARLNHGRWNPYARNVTRQLARKGIRMGIIISPDGEVINGIGRLQFSAENGEELIDCVVVPQEKVEFARMCLNLISMDFDLEGRYADFFRYSSFRRARVVVPGTDMGYGFTMFAFGDDHPINFDLKKDSKLRKQWESYHGSTVMDFGAGRLKETGNLRALGFNVTAFEPFYCPDGDRISREASAELGRAFLDDIENGVEFDSIFLSAVLNSVPFIADRARILCILAACCTTKTRGVFITANSVHHMRWAMMVQEGSGLSRNQVNSAGFVVNYEPGTQLGDLQSGKPKIQKYHSAEEFYDLLSLYFEDVKVGYYLRNVTKGIGRKAKPINPDLLRSALAFEFNMRYPDGERLGLANRAIEAFNARCGLSMPPVDGWLSDDDMWKAWLADEGVM